MVSDPAHTTIRFVLFCSEIHLASELHFGDSLRFGASLRRFASLRSFTSELHFASELHFGTQCGEIALLGFHMWLRCDNYLLVTLSNNFISHLKEHFIPNVFLMMSILNLKSALHTESEI